MVCPELHFIYQFTGIILKIFVCDVQNHNKLVVDLLLSSDWLSKGEEKYTMRALTYYLQKYKTWLKSTL